MDGRRERADRPFRVWPPVHALVGLCLALSAATCGGEEGDDDDDSPSDTFDRQAMLAQLGSQVILPTYQRFATEAEGLHTATGAHLGAVGGGEAATKLEAARAAWRTAMATWEQAELYQVGPAGSSASVMGGQDLRDKIYSWPTVSACRVDQELVEGSYSSPSFFTEELVNVYGMDALEYLLFHDGPDNSCPPQATINSGAWAALGYEEITRRRAEYANAVAGNVVQTAKALVQAWEPTGGDFLGQLSRAGEEGSIYPTAQSAVDELFAAMYYLELDVKDMKLAEPAGISAECTATVCPEALESRFAKASKEHIVNNLKGFQLILLGAAPGSEGVGFDDFLVALGAPELAQSLATETAAAIGAVEAIPGTMDEALVNDLEAVQAAYTAVKRVTDLLKTQFVTVLNLKIPDEGAGDND